MAAGVPPGRLAGGNAGSPGSGRHRSALGRRAPDFTGIEDEAIDALRDAIIRESNGDISVRDTPALAKRRAQSPNFWFLIRDREGHSFSQGRVPLEFASIGDALDGIGQARLGWNILDGMRPTGRMKWIDTPAGNIQILTGRRSSILATDRPCSLDAVFESRAAHRRADDAGYVCCNARGGSPSPCRS